MKKTCLLLVFTILLSLSLTGCSQEPWKDMVDTLMLGDFEKANKQYERIEKNHIQSIKTSEYVYQYIENIVISFKQDFTAFQTIEKKLNLFSLLDMPLYNLETAKEQVERIQASRTAFETGKTLYGEEKYYLAYEQFKQVETDDAKYYDKAQDYLLSIVYVLLYTDKDKYDQAKDVLLAVDVNSKTLERISDYSVELVVRLLYYKDDINNAQKLNDELIQTIILLDESVRESLKSWAEKLIRVYSKPEYSAVCISFLSNNMEDLFYKLEQTDIFIESKNVEYAFIILNSIIIRQETISYIVPRMTEILSQYIEQDKLTYAQQVVDTMFSDVISEEMVKSMVTYIKNNIEKKEYLDKIYLP